MKCLLILLSLVAMNLSANITNTDPAALEFARNTAKNITIVDIRNILIHPTLQNCMSQLIKEAKKYDRRNRSLESALWVTRTGEDSYSCEFWNDNLRVPGGFDWDGYIPQQTLFSIHTHPKKSGGERPSDSDFKFNKQLGMVGLVLSFQRKVISVNYPGSKRYPRVIGSRAFRRYFKRYY